MSSTHVLQSIWTNWHGLWATDMMAMTMLLVFSYQSLNMASWIFKPCIRHMGFTSGSNGSKLDTQQLLLSLFYAVEFSLIASHHPMILKTSLGELDFVPSDYQLIGQMLVFVMAEHLMQLFFMSFYSLYSIEKPMDASGLATDFSVQQTTLLIAIVFVQWPSKGDKAGKWLGELHILAIAGWILVQKVSQTGLEIERIIVEKKIKEDMNTTTAPREDIYIY